MPVQHSLPAKNTRSQRHQAVLTPTAKAPLDRTPSVHQLSANLDRGPTMEGADPSRRGGVKSQRSRSFYGLLGGYPSIPQGPRRSSGKLKMKRGESVQEEFSEEGKVAATLASAPKASEAPNLAPSNKPLVSQAEPKFPKIMEQMKQFMGQLTQAFAPRDTIRAPEFKTPSMKAPDSFYGTKAYKLRGFIQSCQLIFHNDPENFFSDQKKVFYSTFFSLLYTLFADPNEFRKAEQELENLKMKESGQLSSYIADFRSLMSSIGDWGERAYIHVYRRGLETRLLDQLDSHRGNFDSLQELMEITLEFDDRYHERQKEKDSHK
ncbi:hypothetical protein O181_011242 [Austropuccinia psidii MF-1]|uniref:Retrotransposon gag domain-containing protein n=1 Tax=Austropuccinia psidii MF-1 TaxID=1389203 RepID=A0A9Q3BVC8_9BASI|nr:hypothetical protein [Austropuccinia psidii MF-1]